MVHTYSPGGGEQNVAGAVRYVSREQVEAGYLGQNVGRQANLTEVVSQLEKQSGDALRMAIAVADSVGVKLPDSCGVVSNLDKPSGVTARLIEAGNTMRSVEVLLERVRGLL